MLALHGFDAYGLEVSQKAVDTANAYADRELQRPSEHHFADVPTWLNVSRGRAQFVCGDFFQRDWEKSCVSDGVQGFDLIYDYTVRSPAAIL
jgi:hypothetical protein